MFSQRNNPYCELLQLLPAKLNIPFEPANGKSLTSQNFLTERHGKDTGVGFGDEQHWLGCSGCG
jgi:hypothetical protein